MKKILVCILFILGLSIQPSYAESFETSFIFVSVDLNTNRDTVYQAKIKKTVLMPTGSKWSCEKVPVFKMPDGDITGGFVCKTSDNTDEDIIVSVKCSLDKPNADHSGMLIHSKNSSIQFFAACETKPHTTQTGIVMSKFYLIAIVAVFSCTRAEPLESEYTEYGCKSLEEDPMYYLYYSECVKSGEYSNPYGSCNADYPKDCIRLSSLPTDPNYNIFCCK